MEAEGSLKSILVLRGITSVRKKDDGRIFAMKIISKRLASHWKGELVKREFELWKEMNNLPFIVKMVFSYTTEDTFNFVMDYCPGGTLLQRLNKEGKLQPYIALVYFLELLTVFETIHENNIIYRDLKVVFHFISG